MNNEQPPSNGICPCCLKVPEQLSRKGPWVFNRVFNRYICQGCNIELTIEFYEDDSRYFEMASKMSGMDIWEIKRRYIEDVLNTCMTNLSGENNMQERELLSEEVATCKKQIGAIQRYLTVKQTSSNPKEITWEYRKMKICISDRVIDLDYALPNLVMVEIP